MRLVKKSSTLRRGFRLFNRYTSFAKQLIRLHLRDAEEIDDLKQTHRVDEQHDDKPPRLRSTSRVPESESFPKYAPKDDDEKNERKPNEPRIIERRSIKRIEVVHINKSE